MPALIGFGLWALINGELSMGLASVVIITIGIVVDDTVHFLSKYQYSRQQLNESVEGAVRYAFQHVGTALWTTTIVLVSGFSLMMLSKLSSNVDFGLLTSIILLAALVLDFFAIAIFVITFG